MRFSDLGQKLHQYRQASLSETIDRYCNPLTALIKTFRFPSHRREVQCADYIRLGRRCLSRVLSAKGWKVMFRMPLQARADQAERRQCQPTPPNGGVRGPRVDGP
jgi:hypothetical protein